MKKLYLVLAAMAMLSLQNADAQMCAPAQLNASFTDKLSAALNCYQYVQVMFTNHDEVATDAVTKAKTTIRVPNILTQLQSDLATVQNESLSKKERGKAVAQLIIKATSTLTILMMFINTIIPILESVPEKIPGLSEDNKLKIKDGVAKMKASIQSAMDGVTTMKGYAKLLDSLIPVPPVVPVGGFEPEKLSEEDLFNL